MKKTSFLKGLTMAFVAMVCAFTTSCTEEELKVNGSENEVVKPYVSLTTTVVDFESRVTLKVENKDVTADMGKTISVDCPVVEGYTVAKSVDVAVPTIGNGQSANIPVTFYVVTMNSALKELMETLEPVAGTKVEVPEAEKEIAVKDAEALVNKTAYDVDKTATFDIFDGKEIYTETESKAASTIADILSEMKFETKEAYVELTLGAWCQATVKVIQKFYKEDYTATYNGEETTVTLLTAGEAIFSAEFGVIPGYEHDYKHNNHGHGGHGSSNNAGGGIIIAE